MTNCKVCGAPRPIAERCKPCAKIKNAARYSRNREAILAKKAAYYAEHRSEIAKRMSEWHAKTRPIRLARSRAWFLANQDQARVAARLYYERNKAACSQRAKAYRLRNGEKIKALNKAWRLANREKIYASIHKRRALKRSCAGSHTAQEWQAILRAHNNRCAHCNLSGRTTRLTRDHIIPLSAGGTDFAYNLQPLCSKCNSQKKNRLPSVCQFSLFDLRSA